MALVADNVRVAVTGGVYVGAIGTATPANATAPVDAKLKDLGYISEDGVTQSIDSDTNEIKAWQNGDVVRVIQTSHKVTFQFTLIETNEEVLKLFYADAAANGSLVKMTGAQSPHQTFVLDVLDGKKVLRIVIPDGQVTERGEVTYKNGEAVGYQVTVTAYPDSQGVKAYKHLGTKL